MRENLKKFNLTVKPHEHVFFKGSSGTGKSTICKLLYRLIEADKGNILIGGVSIFDYSLSTIREGICYVSQTEALYTASIKENIIFNRDISMLEFNEVCKICKLESIASKRPLRYESIISDDTTFLSGGEKQRIILARALLKKSDIIILDEPLSEVDYKTEREIIKNILQKFKNKTIIYISHKNQAKLFNRTVTLGDAFEQ